MDNKDFVHELIKGRIAETIFEMMFRNTGRFTVHRLGYEYTEPLVAQYQDKAELDDVLKTIRHTPDFIIIEEAEQKKGIFIVEVKYRRKINKKENREIAEEILKHWNPSWLFIATPERFFFSPCSSVLKDGDISPLSESWASGELQNKYLELLRDFEGSH